jgi:hypothetical protein
MMNGMGKSDNPGVPKKLSNKAEEPAAETGEGSGLAKGNSLQQNALRTPSRESALSALVRVAAHAALFPFRWPVGGLLALIELT